jgi:hypothetical protein
VLGRLPVEDGEKVCGSVDRELGRELEKVAIPGHESGPPLRCERDQVAVPRILGCLSPLPVQAARTFTHRRTSSSIVKVVRTFA